MAKAKRAVREGNLFQGAVDRAQPLAARMRPATLDEFVGQEHVLAPGRALRDSIEKGTIGSVVPKGVQGISDVAGLSDY